MSAPEKVGEIPKPAAEDFKKGRRLFFVPLIYGGKESPAEYLEKNSPTAELEERLASITG